MVNFSKFKKGEEDTIIEYIYNLFLLNVFFFCMR